MRFSKCVLFFTLSLLDHRVILLMTKKNLLLATGLGVRYGNPSYMGVMYAFSHLFRDAKRPEPGNTKETLFLAPRSLQSIG